LGSLKGPVLADEPVLGLAGKVRANQWIPKTVSTEAPSGTSGTRTVADGPRANSRRFQPAAGRREASRRPGKPDNIGCKDKKSFPSRDAQQHGNLCMSGYFLRIVSFFSVRCAAQVSNHDVQCCGCWLGLGFETLPPFRNGASKRVAMGRVSDQARQSSPCAGCGQSDAQAVRGPHL
jgi:hypothetical protein